MPYPNEHAARMIDPGKFQAGTFRRKKISGSRVEMILGKLKGEQAMTVQAYRFPKSEYTIAEAKAWLKEQGETPKSFEPAVENNDDSEECPECGAIMEAGKCSECEYAEDGCGKRKKDSALPTVNRIDSVMLPQSLTRSFLRTTEGFLKGRAIVTNVGVFTYMDGMGKSHTELRLPEEVFDWQSIESLKMKPLTNDHPTEIVTPDNIKKYQVGNLGDNPGSEVQGSFVNWEQEKMTDGMHLAVDIIVTDNQAIEDVLNGKRALSCGYTCELEKAPEGAKWCGVNYDYIQRSIRYNHVAIVDEARAGDMARIRLDSSDAVQVVDNKSNKEGDMPELMKKVTLDGVEYSAEAPVLVALNTEKQRADRAENDLKSAAEKHKADMSTLEAERDGLKEKLDAKEKEIEALKADSGNQEKLDAAVSAKLELLRTAEKAGVEVKKDMADLDIKKEVILKVFPSAKLDGKDEVYIQARFDTAVEELETAQGNDAESRRLTGDGIVPGADGNKPGKNDAYDSEAAKKKYHERLYGGNE